MKTPWRNTGTSQCDFRGQWIHQMCPINILWTTDQPTCQPKQNYVEASMWEFESIFKNRKAIPYKKNDIFVWL